MVEAGMPVDIVHGSDWTALKIAAHNNPHLRRSLFVGQGSERG